MIGSTAELTRSSLVGAFVLCANAAAQAQTVPEQSSIRAVAVTQPPNIDGRLTEDVWRTAPAITRLTQREPREGAPAIESSEIRFAYDEEALYVGARMYSDNPSDIRALVTRRDQEGSSEFIAVSLDTYHDRRTAYSFAVTAAGVRIDVFHPNDNDDSDEGFDPVWEARSYVDSLGWTAEMRIPFSQLRFSPRDEQVWGLNVIRRVPARNEDSYWMLIRRQETGWASRMGTLTGIRGIRPSRRIEALPYVASSSRVAPITDAANPFQERATTQARVGGDLKMGLGPNVTLDLTLNPDFGQVEADPAEVNLSAYETFFDERRPFFTEGADLLNRRDLFYSRRIGAPPPGNPSAEFAEERANSTILGAAKLTGRLPSKLSLAALAAVTDREVVRTFDSSPSPGVFGSATVAPRTLYALASAQQEFGANASTLSAMLGTVQRDVGAGTPLADLLPRSALSGTVDGRYRWAAGKYDVNAWLAFTDVRGDSAAILRQQLSSRRYWQRPDANHARVDPARRAIAGTFVGVGHSKMAGEHWLWDIDYSHQTPGFEPNDLGASGAVDNRYLATQLRWRETTPSRWYRDYVVGMSQENGWAYDWLRRERGVDLSANVTLANYWEIRSDYYWNARAESDRLTRGGPVMGTPEWRGGAFEIESREGARNRWGVEARRVGPERRLRHEHRAEPLDASGHAIGAELRSGMAARAGRPAVHRRQKRRTSRDVRHAVHLFGRGPAGDIRPRPRELHVHAEPHARDVRRTLRG
jgi:hypothetical protein